jgi:surfeit locus 1 family protein
LVNRGFVPERFKSSTKRQAGQVIGEMTLTGVIRLPERPGRFVPANQPDRNLWYSRDIEAMTRHSKFTAAAPFMVDLKTPIPPGGLPQPGPGRQTIANPHLNYAFTWFALAVCLAVIFGIFLRRRSAGA